MTNNEMLSKSFLAQALKERHDDSPPGTSYSGGDGLNNLSSSYSGNQRSDGVMNSPFYATSLSSEQPSPLYIDHLFPKFQSNVSSPWKMDNVGVSTLTETNSVEENTDNVRRTLIETGQMDRLRDLVDRRLSEVGWKLDMMECCRDIIKERGSGITHQELFEVLKVPGNKKVPDVVKTEVLQKIKYCYESAIPSQE